MGFKQLRQSTPIEEFDYQLLMSHLMEYSNKRDVVTRLMKNEKIIRVKKGLYIFGPEERRGLFSKETLANLIYGPSYISFEYALSYYGMIPERVEVLTSATTGRSRKFITPIGAFSYRQLPIEKYAIGIALIQLDDYHSVFIATPEKALLDLIYFSRGLSKKIDAKHYFRDDLRIDVESLKDLSQVKLIEIATAFSCDRVNRMVNYIIGLQNA